MASKVEELRKAILKTVGFMSPYDLEMMRTRLTRLVEASRAEGAAAERERIRANSGCLHKGDYASSDNCFDDMLQRESGEFVTVAVCDCYVTPASLLAPDKEEPEEGEDEDPNADAEREYQRDIMRGIEREQARYNND